MEIRGLKWVKFHRKSKNMGQGGWLHGAVLGSRTSDLHQHCDLEEERPYMEYQQEVWIYINFNDRDVKCVLCVCSEREWAVTHMGAPGSICPHPTSAWGSENQGENFSVIWRSRESGKVHQERSRRKSCSHRKSHQDIRITILLHAKPYMTSYYLYVILILTNTVVLHTRTEKKLQKRFCNGGRTEEELFALAISWGPN